jgi:hypothetical protein
MKNHNTLYRRQQSTSSTFTLLPTEPTRSTHSSRDIKTVEIAKDLFVYVAIAITITIAISITSVGSTTRLSL